jgi:L-aminopeptidase/D-esterase-like protein
MVRGDIFLAFSTANENAFNRDETTTVKSMPDDQLMPVFGNCTSRRGSDY